jgi:hypothetical protein
MDNQDLRITITGVDKASKVFDAVVDSAEKIGPALDEATGGARRLKPAAQEAVKAIDPLDDKLDETGRAAKDAGKSVEQSARSFDQYRTAARDAAAGLALVGTAFTMYSQQARSHEIAIMALERTYGTAAASFVAFADQMQSTTIFSNDQVIEAANVMGTLQRNYGLTTEQIKELIVVSGDLAATKGITLVDAATRVSAAIRGEAESAEYLGLAMNQSAIDQNNLTLSMSNTEAGAFRYNAVMEQSAFALGAAGDAADTTTGKTQQLANEFQDAMMSVVNFTGPVGEAAAGLGSFGVEAAIAVGGLGQLAKGLAGLRGAASIAGLAALLTGPAGLAIGFGVAAAAGWKLVDSMTGSGALYESILQTHEQVAALNAEVLTLASGMQDAAMAVSFIEDTEALGRFVDDTRVYLQEYQDLWNLYGDPDAWMQIPGNAEVYAQNSQIADDIDRLRWFMTDFGDSAEVAGQQLDGVLASWSQIASSQNIDAIEDAQTAWDTFNTSLKREADYDALEAELTRISGSLDEYTRAEIEAAAATEAHTNVINTNVAAISGQTQAQIAANAEFRQWLELQGLAQQYDQEQANNPRIGSENQVNWLVKYQQTLDATALSLAGFGEVSRDVAADVTAMVTAVGDTSKRGYDTYTEAVEQSKRATEDFDMSLRIVGATLKDDIAVELGSVEAAYRTLADSARKSIGALDANTIFGSTFGGVVGAAQGFAQLSENVWDWSRGLTEGNKATSILNDLNSKGLISDKTYRDGLEANHRIMLANNSVQEDSLRIQAKQLPLMAQLAEEQARYVDEIADMPAQQQLVALGFADQAKTTQALELAQLAAASSTKSMQASTSEMIAAVAAADPQLKAMLISMGLISEGADGTITVNFGDSQSQTTDLIASIDALTLALGGIPPDVKVTMVAEDHITAEAYAVQGALDLIDGRVVTTYLKTVNTNLFDQLNRNMHGGVVGKYASGGVVAEMGEAGPELLQFPTGGWGLAATHSFYNVPPGTSVLPAPATRDIIDKAHGRGRPQTVYKGNTIHQFITVDESALGRRSAAMAARRRG